ncbi:MAG TPA: hypothetical protein VJ851_03835 [Jatrophihabitans sp.]|nr:hypothetical protein [Jatrophihabitans sp.]
MDDRIRFALSDGLELVGTDVDELWWHYVAIGGEAGPGLLAARISGVASCDLREYALIAQALNECFVDRGLNTFPVGYCPQLAGSMSVSGFLGSLSGLSGSRPAGIEARRRAVEARLHSVAAARQAALLHLTAARLMQTSGQLHYARQALQRADRARVRANRAMAEVT